MLEAMRGAAAVVRQFPAEYRPDIHGRAGLAQADWEVLRSRAYWTPEQVRTARGAIDKILTAALTMSGLPAISLPAEYVAAVISAVIEPANWMAASHAGIAGLDGRQLVSSQGDVVSAREFVSPERLFSLILVYSDTFCHTSRQPDEQYVNDVTNYEEEQKG